MLLGLLLLAVTAVAQAHKSAKGAQPDLLCQVVGGLRPGQAADMAVQRRGMGTDQLVIGCALAKLAAQQKPRIRDPVPFRHARLLASQV